MAVQKRRQSSARRDHRRSQWMARVATPNVNTCPQCGEPKLSHRICLKCGSYKGIKVVDVAVKGEESAE